jgi:cytoskeletal protein RodZ
MSLINDALKKAQKQRTDGLPPLGSMPGVGGERAADLSHRARGSSGAPTGMLLGVGLGAVGLLALGVAGFLFLRSRPDTPAPAPERPVATVSTPPAATAATAAPAPSASAPAKETVFVLPVAAPAPAAAPAKAVATAPTQPATQPKAATNSPPVQTTATPAPATEAARPAGRLEPRAVQYIDNIRVAGIRASATDSKVLMNDRVYRIGDVVEHEMGLRLVGITTSSLTFEDDRGGRYTRNF